MARPSHLSMCGLENRLDQCFYIKSGVRVTRRDREGMFSRDLGDGEHAEIKIADRTYRVRVADLA